MPLYYFDLRDDDKFVSDEEGTELSSMAKDKELKDLFLDTLKDIYFAEKKILSALPKMAKAAQSSKLKAAFGKHHTETDGQVERLEQIFASIDETAKGKTCDAIMASRTARAASRLPSQQMPTRLAWNAPLNV